MKNVRLLLSCLSLCLLAMAGVVQSARAQTTAPNKWTWMGGSQVPYVPGVYGTLGVPASGNMPGSRLGAAAWTDNKGHLWLFGGSENDTNGSGFQNDLWEFNPATNQWAWINGSEPALNSSGPSGVYTAPGAVPGGRAYAFTWADSNGFLWLLVP